MYEWLKDYHRLEEEVTYLEFNLEQSERELKRWVEGDLSGIKLQADSDGAKLEERIERIKDDLEESKKQINKLTLLVSKFKGLDNHILRLKYIEGYTLERIATHLNYDYQYIKNKHSVIMKIVKFADEIKGNI